MKLCHETERLCISLKMIEVLFHLRTQYHIGKDLGYRSSLKSDLTEIPFKPFPDRSLPKMSKRRISNIMDQARTFQNMTDIFFHLHREPGIFTVFQNIFTDILSQ